MTAWLHAGGRVHVRLDHADAAVRLHEHGERPLAPHTRLRHHHGLPGTVTSDQVPNVTLTHNV